MNISGNLSEEDNEKKVIEYFTTDEVIAGSTILVVLILSAFIGNVLTCLIICKKPSFRTSTNISILFLSLSDVLMASLVMPFSLVSLIGGRWLFSLEACTFNAFIISHSLGVSLITMTCTAVIRYLCVVKPALHHQHVKPKITAIATSVLWLGCSIVQAITVSSTSAYGFYAETRLHCVYDFHAKIVAVTINFTALAAAFILGTIIFLSYFKVFRFVSHHNQTAIPNLQQPSVSHIQEAKITKTLVIVVLGFVFCWGPVTVIQFIDMFLYSRFNHSRMPNVLFLFQTICIFASSAINPFIYGFTNKRFSKQYFELLGSLCPSAPQVAPVASGNS